MGLLIIFMNFLALFIYLFFFIKKTSKIALTLKDRKDKNQIENNIIDIFTAYKLISNIVLFLLLCINLILSKYIDIKFFVLVYNILILFSFMFIKLNINLIYILLSVIYSKSNISQVPKEYLFGCIYQNGLRYEFKYRLTRTKFYI